MRVFIMPTGGQRFSDTWQEIDEQLLARLCERIRAESPYTITRVVQPDAGWLFSWDGEILGTDFVLSKMEHPSTETNLEFYTLTGRDWELSFQYKRGWWTRSPPRSHPVATMGGNGHFEDAKITNAENFKRDWAIITLIGGDFLFEVD